MTKRTLNLGCGMKKMPEAVNVDRNADAHPDVLHDLSRRPWPFEDSSFERVYALDVLEHLEDTVASMEELHRVTQPGGVVHLQVPHFSNFGAYCDPTHRRFFGYQTFKYFTGENDYGFYTRRRFVRRDVRLHFYPGRINRLVQRYANRRPDAYEARWCWVFPAGWITAELVVVKP